jgi:alpha-tubulin suppressor-like RCC1 family protein
MRVTPYYNFFVIYLVSITAFTSVIFAQDLNPPYENPKVTVVSDFFDWESIISDRLGYTVTSVSTIDEGLISGILKHKINFILDDTGNSSEVVREINISEYREDTNGNGIFDILEIDRSFVKTFTGTEVATFKDTQTNSSQGIVTADVQYLLKRSAGSIELEVTMIGKVKTSSVFEVFAGDELDALISYLDLSNSFGEILLDELQNTYELELNATTPEGIFSHLHSGELIRTSSDSLTLKNFPSIGKNQVITYSDLTLKAEGNILTGQHRSGNYNYVVSLTTELDGDRDGKSNLVDNELNNQVYVRTEQNSMSYLTKDFFLFIDNENTLWRVWDSNKTKIVSNVDSIQSSYPLSELIKLKDGSFWLFIDSFNLYEIKDQRDIKSRYDLGYYFLFQPSGDDLWGIGNNWGGQLGIGKKWSEETGYYYEPEPVQILDSGVVSAGAGWNYSLFTKNDGSLWGMGTNPLFSFTSDQNESLYPVKIPGIDNVSSVKLNSIALITKNDQSLWGLGVYEPIFTNHFEFADPEKNRIRLTTPYLLSSEPVTHSQIGGGATTFVKSNGSLWGIGYNHFAVLGKDSPSYVSDPVQILPSGVYSSHQSIGQLGGSLAVVKTNGELWDLGFSEVWPNWEENASNHLIPNSRRVTAETIPRSEFIHISAKTDLDETLAFSGTYETGSKITLSAPANEDREFSHWVIIPPEDDSYYHSEYSELEVFSAKQDVRIISGTDLELVALYTDKDDDNDGLTNAEERNLGTNSNSEDSDSDGLSDYDEIHTHRTNPALADTDGDGLMDGTEVSTGHDPKVENDKERIQKLITLLKNENLNFVFPEGWFFTESKGWQWTNSTVYPWVYSNKEKGWMYFSVISKRPFYSYQTKSWSNY